MAELFRFESSRRFSMWFYSASHSRVLLRSPKTDSDPRRLDVMFYGVARMHLDTSMDGLAITEDAEGDPGLLRGIARRYGKEQLYRVASAANDGWLIAAEVRVHEDDREYWERSALDPALQGRVGMERGSVCELWCRDGSGSPEVVLVQKSSEGFVAREPRADGALVFRDDRYEAVRDWLEAHQYDYVAQRGESSPEGPLSSAPA